MNELKRKDMVPEKTPSILVTSSPESMRSCSVERTGRPAPTLDSWKICPPEPEPFAAASKMEFQRSREPENPFLLGVTMWMPFSRKSGYASATSWLEVLSTRMTGFPALER